MHHRRLGNSGLVVSEFALGTMTFGAKTEEQEAFSQLDTFVEAGGTLIDTADVYADGAAERVIGRWLAARPVEDTDRVVVATKGRFPTASEPNGVGLSRRHLDRALTASLRRLGVDCIDLYQLHAYDPLTPIEETLGFLTDAVRAGKIRYVGLSNFTGWQLRHMVDVATAAGAVPPISLQFQYNLLTRQTEWEMIPAARSAALGLLPWSPLASGMLTGKYRRDTEPAAGTRFGETNNRQSAHMYAAHSARPRTWKVIDELEAIAEQRGTSPSRLALAWVAGRPGVSSVIVGASTLAQLDDNLAATGMRLGEEEADRLEAASDPDADDYPYGKFGTVQRTRPVAGGRAQL